MDASAEIHGLSLRILTYLADAYLPVVSEWVDCSQIASEFGLPVGDIELRCHQLERQTLIEVAAPDQDNPNAAALITVKGLLAIGRVP